MIGLLALLLVMATVCVFLGNWQLDRARQRGALKAQQVAAEAQAGGIVPVGDVLAAQSAFPGNLVGRSVTVAGVYEPDGQLLVPGRTVDGRVGALVLTGLRVTDDGTDGQSWAELSGVPVLPVVRGWVPADTAEDDPVLTVPDGEVKLTVYLQASEAAGDAPADGRIAMISSAQLLAVWQGPIYSGYGVVAESDPAQSAGLVAVPRPTVENGEGLNVQNLFYAVEWFVFAGFAIALWVRVVRDAKDAADPLAVAS